LLAKGDPSLGVEAAALSVYGKQQRPDTVKVVTPWLDKPSNNERLRNAALTALGDSRDLAATSILIDWTKRGKPPQCRTAALSALGLFTKDANLAEGEREKAVQAIAALLDEDNSRLRRMAINALQTIGAPARSALKRLDEIADHDAVENNAEAAKKAAAAIRAVPGSQEIKQLREELDRLKKEQEELRKRLEKYEKAEKNGPE
jgi:aminopeptidase N